MSLWLRIAANVATQAKFIKAGPAASWLWLAGVAHCRNGSTDGYIPREVASTLVPGIRPGQAAKLIQTLLEVNLWEPADGGYLVHDYLEWNPSRASLEERRAWDRNRKAGRLQSGSDAESDRIPDGFHAESDRIPDGFHAESLRARGGARRGRASSPSPSALESSRLSGEESAREGGDAPVSAAAPAWRAPSARPPSLGAVEGVHRRRGCPAWGLAACREDFCVPSFLARRWEERWRTAHMDLPAWQHALRAFVERVMVEQPPEPGDDPKVFWPTRMSEHFPTSAKPAGPPKGRTDRIFDAAEEVIAQQLARRDS